MKATVLSILSILIVALFTGCGSTDLGRVEQIRCYTSENKGMCYQTRYTAKNAGRVSKWGFPVGTRVIEAWPKSYANWLRPRNPDVIIVSLEHFTDPGYRPTSTPHNCNP